MSSPPPDRAALRESAVNLLWHPEAYGVLRRVLGAPDPGRPYTVERLDGAAVTVVERCAWAQQAAWVVEWLHATRTDAEVAAGLDYRVGVVAGATTPEASS